MEKINKIVNIAVIFMLIIGVVLCPQDGYALRVPIDIPEDELRIKTVEEAVAKKEELIKPGPQEEIPTNFRLKSTGERLAVIKMDKKIFKMHKGAMVDIAKTLYDTTPVESLKYALPEIVNGQLCYVAKLNGRVVGYVFAYDDESKVTIETFGVKRDKEGKGIGNALIWVVAREAQNRNITVIVAKGADPTNKRMLEFFEKHGFRMPEDNNSKRRFNFEAPVSYVFEKAAEKLVNDMLIDIKSNLTDKIRIFLRSVKVTL